MSNNIGFVGLGIMGRPMAKNLLKAGHKVTVYDIMPAGIDEVVAAGAGKGSSPKDVASRTDIIITMVPDGPEVEQAVLGQNGVLEGAKSGSIVIESRSTCMHTTITHTTVCTPFRRCLAQGRRLRPDEQRPHPVLIDRSVGGDDLELEQ